MWHLNPREHIQQGLLCMYVSIINIASYDVYVYYIAFIQKVTKLFLDTKASFLIKYASYVYTTFYSGFNQASHNSSINLNNRMCRNANLCGS